MTKHVPDLTTRNCRKCGNSQMVSLTRQRDFLSVKSVFQCPKCAHQVVLASKITGRQGGGALGVSLAVGGLATAILSYILWGYQSGYSAIEAVKTLFLFVFFTSPIWWDLFQIQRYPVTGKREKVSTDLHNEGDPQLQDPLQKGISVLDGINASKGFFGLLLAVSLFLGIAALIGWINFTYFDDNLFG